MLSLCIFLPRRTPIVSSPIKNVDLQDSMDVSLVNAMNEEEKAKALRNEREKSLEIIAKLKEAIQQYDVVSLLN